MNFPWKHTKTGLAILMNISPIYEQDFEKKLENQKLFCCVNWMTDKVGKCKVFMAEDLKLEKKKGVKGLLKNVVRSGRSRRTKNQVKDSGEEFKPLLL